MKELVIGQEYFYWNKSIGEKEATRKPCRLQSLDGRFARVVRLDLEINRVQVIVKSRLAKSAGSNRWKGRNEQPTLDD